MPVRHKPATSVEVFQWPWGTGSSRRWPRVIFVVADVSSRKIRCIQGGLPDDEPPARGDDVRPSLLGGVQTFFDGDPVAFEEPPERRLADANAMPGRQFRAYLGQRQVRLMSDKRQDRLAMPTQARAMVTPHWSGARLTLGTPPLRPADRGALAHPEPLGRRAGRTAGGYGRRQAIPQVLR